MIKPVFTLGTSLEAKEIRQEVFVKEQGFQNEFDEYEKTATTLVLFLDDIPIATGRLRTLDPETYQIERVAVRKPYRGKRIGTYVVKFLCTKIKTLGGRKAVLHARVDAIPFYQRLGFIVLGDGEILYEEGMPHVEMGKVLVKVQASQRRYKR